MAQRKVTFKQRIRKNDMKRRHKASAELRKRVGVGRRTHNRFDTVDTDSRPMGEIVRDIAQGMAVPSQEFTLDPRGLTDILLQSAKTAQRSGPDFESDSDAKGGEAAGSSRRKAIGQAAKTALLQPGIRLPTAPLPQDDPAALPDLGALVQAAQQRKLAEEQAAAAAGETINRNLYRHHGQPFVFWERVGLHPLLVQALRAMKFTHPTPVQEEVLPAVFISSATDEQKGGYATEKAALSAPDEEEGEGPRKGPAKSAAQKRAKALRSESKRGKGDRRTDQVLQDIVVSAETGSGKTLVFALPILNDILHKMQEDGNLNLSSTAEPLAGAAEAVKTAMEKKERNQKRTRVSVSSSLLSTNSSSTSGGTGGSRKHRLMHSLVVSPTRELALQIRDAFKQLTRFAPGITVGCVVGGMASEKQQRVLNRHPDILICTPGRLWDLVERNEGCYLGHSISRRLRFVVLDEADKLLQSGRFEQLKSILERIHGDVLPAGFVQEREEGAEVGEVSVEAGRWDPITQTFIPLAKENGRSAAGAGKTRGKEATNEDAQRRKRRRKEPRGMEGSNPNEATKTEEDEDDEEGASEANPKSQRSGRKDRPWSIPMPPPPPENHRVVTYVTSATLSLQTNYERKDLKSSRKIIRTSNADVMGKVLQELEIKPSNAQIFSLSPNAMLAAKINETYLRCPENSKDLYLYYFLKMFSDERTVVFVNAISMLRRIVKIIEVLGIPVVGLHASMQQRQRLKFIGKFKAGDIRVLVATDIASRGLDIDGLKYVVHYQVPRSTDTYIHRCGRTARCGGAGLSLLLVSAAEHTSFRKLLESLGRKESELETFAMQPTIVYHLHPHLRIALQIDKLQKEIGKTRANNQWVQRMSKEADLEVDDMYDDEADAENREKLKAIKLLKKELDRMTKKFMGSYGGKGAFRTGASALGTKSAEEKMRTRAERQTLRLNKK